MIRKILGVTLVGVSTLYILIVVSGGLEWEISTPILIGIVTIVMGLTLALPYKNRGGE